MLLPCAVALLLAQSASQTPPTLSGEELRRHVQVRLATRDGKTTFRTGDPIRLILSFASDAPDFHVDLTSDKWLKLEDEIVITPDRGVFRWFDAHTIPDWYHTDSRMTGELSARPIDMPLALNYWFRFDEPGDYTVRIRTRRVSKRVGIRPVKIDDRSLTTNEVSFKVVRMTPQEEEAEARRLGVLLETLPPGDFNRQSEICEDLAFLTGDAATREKVYHFLHPLGRYATYWTTDLGMGLYISNNSQLVVSTLEDEMRNPASPFGFISATAGVRLWMEMPRLVAAANGDMELLRTRRRERATSIQLEYIDEAIASLSRRTGRARGETAASLYTWLSPRYTPSPRPAAIPSLRKIIVDEFGALDPTTQASLVRNYWRDIHDASLLPHLEKLAKSDDPEVHRSPMGAILDLSPERAKPIFIAEMLGPRWIITDNVFFQLPDATLPELDHPLVEQITGLIGSQQERDRELLLAKASYLSRYASAAVKKEIQQLYDTRGPQIWEPARESLKKYLDRWR